METTASNYATPLFYEIWVLFWVTTAYSTQLARELVSPRHSLGSLQGTSPTEQFWTWLGAVTSIQDNRCYKKGEHNIAQCTLSSKNHFSAKVGWDKSQPSQTVPPGLQGTAASTPLDSLQLPKVFFLVVKIFDCLCSTIKAKRKKRRKEGGISSSGSLRNLDSRHKNKVHTQWKIGSVKIAISDLQQALFLH